MSQLLNLMGTGSSQSTTGILGNDSSTNASSSFEALLKQIIDTSQNQTSTNVGTSVPSNAGTVNGLDSLSLQSQKAQQLQQMVMQQMMQIMTTQDTSNSSSIGSVESDDSSGSLFPSTNNNDLVKLLQTIVQAQSDTSATTNGQNNFNQDNSVQNKNIL